MDSAAHGFVRPPPRLDAKTTTAAASAGGPAGPPPRLCARQQVRAVAHGNEYDNDDRIGTEEQRGMVQAWVAHFVTPLKCTYDEYD